MLKTVLHGLWDYEKHDGKFTEVNGNIVLTLRNASYGGTVALGSSPQVNGADVLWYHKPKFYKFSLLRECVVTLIPDRNKTYIIIYALCVSSIRLPLPR